MKKVIRIKESELRNMIYESVREMVEEGDFLNQIKSGLWKSANALPNLINNSTDERNPYTYNKKHFYYDMPDKNSKEYQKLQNADDGLLVNSIILYCEHMKEYLKGETNDISDRGMWEIRNCIRRSEECGLTRYADYMKDLYGLVKHKRGREWTN
ncbi:MAG: hypothetical protein IJ722_03700 [Alloprevotella sp.]|nr:hypothetical protein [Alloprevotella sp.]